jgi:serine phosphatase RsbU (regulator of sigma subunit)
VAGLADLAEIIAEEFGLHMQAGQALIRERTGRTRAEGLTRTLEQSLRPSAVPMLPGLELAVSYHPTDGQVVGGDFYDAFTTPSGYGLVIGDVRGHGPAAAAVTATARHGVAALVQQPWSPAWALESLNALMLQQGKWDPELFCTVALLQLRSTGDGGMDATVGLAGHPTPLVVRRDGTVEAIGTPGTALGLTGDPSFPEVGGHLEPGDTLVMYTDGVTEVRAADAIFDASTLRALLERLPGRPADEVAAAVERAVTDAAGGFGDDTAVLVARPVGVSRPSRVVHTTG